MTRIRDRRAALSRADLHAKLNLPSYDALIAAGADLIDTDEVARVTGRLPASIVTALHRRHLSVGADLEPRWNDIPEVACWRAVPRAADVAALAAWEATRPAGPLTAADAATERKLRAVVLLVNYVPHWHRAEIMAWARETGKIDADNRPIVPRWGNVDRDRYAAAAAA